MRAIVPLLVCLAALAATPLLRAQDVTYGQDFVGSGTILATGQLRFIANASAGSATINNLGNLFFSQTSTAGSAVIFNAGQIYFEGTSSAGSASINNGVGYITLSLHDGPLSIGAFSGSGILSLGTNALTLGGLNQNTTYHGTISGGSLTKTGTGSFTLTNSNTYIGGTTVNAGTLLASNSTGSALGSGAVTVNAGATLGGNGFIGGLTTVNAGAHLAPGNSPGTLTFNQGLTLNSGAFLDFELGDPFTPLTSDLVAIAGGALSGPASGLITLNLSDAGGFGPGTYNLIDASSASAINDLAPAAFAFGSTVSGYAYSLDWNGSVLQLTASAVPEPSTYAALAGILVLGLALHRKRRR
jgi:fibronectin-binding autotransporter adhesin